MLIIRPELTKEEKIAKGAEIKEENVRREFRGNQTEWVATKNLTLVLVKRRQKHVKIMCGEKEEEKGR